MAIEKKDTRSRDKRILDLANAFDLDHVAKLLNMRLPDVEEIVARSQSRSKITRLIVNCDTREQIPVATWRAGYFKVCVMGWKNWDFGVIRR